jgi:hypothetical protein
MRVEEWFALAVRVIGVLIFLYGAGYLLDSLLFRLGYFNYPESSPAYYVVAGISYGIVGLYLMRGASHLVRFAYPVDEEQDESDGHEEEADRQDA